MKKLSLNDFIIKANDVHGNKYDYSKTIYINVRSKVEIICPIHNSFFQKPITHLAGKGCKKCGTIKSIAGCINSLLKTKDLFINESILIHGNKYDYSKVNYKNTDRKVIIICPTHGEFKQNPSSHIRGSGCNKCGLIKKAISKTFNTNMFVQKAKEVHKNKYDYFKSVYTKNKNKLIITCLIHGDFFQIAADHLNGHGCKFCGAYKNEQLVAEFFDEKNIAYMNLRIDLNINGEIKRCFPDFYLPQYNMFIEYNGRQHYEPVIFQKETVDISHDRFEKQLQRDFALREFCKNNSVELLEIDGRKYTNKKIHKLLTSVFLNKKSIVDSKIIKPWGFEEILRVDDKYTIKRLFMKENERCSIQKHLYKYETIMVFSGELNLYIGTSLESLEKRTLSSGDVVHIEPNIIHRMEGKTDCIYFETSTSHLFDVVRLVDDYNRI